MTAPDTIEIRRLKISTRIGVPDDERAQCQTLLATVKMIPSQGFNGLADNISNTVDYYAVSLEIQAIAASKPRRLIETLALEIIDHLLKTHPLKTVSITIEKYILPDTECVAVHLIRER